MWLGIRGAQIQSEIQVRTTSPRNSATGQLCCQLCQMFWSFAFVSFAKRYHLRGWSLSKLCWCTHQIIKTGSYQTGSVSSFQVTYLMRPPQFTSRWVRRAGWEIKYFDASFFSSSSSAGPVAPVGNWLETSDPATRQLKCQSSPLIVTDPAFSRAWMDKENADFRRVQQTRQNPTTLALPLVELLFLLVFIPQFLTCSLPGEGKTWLGVLPMKWMGFVMLWLVSD